MEDKKLFIKVLTDAIKNIIYFGIGSIVIIMIANILHWRVFALIFAGLFTIIVVISLIPFLIAFVSGIIVIPITIKEKNEGKIESFKNQCWFMVRNIYPTH